MRIQWWPVLASCLVLSCSGDKTTGDSGGGDADTDTDSDTDTDADTDTDTVVPPECPGLASATVCQGSQTFTASLAAGTTYWTFYYYWSYGTPTVLTCPEVALKFNSAGNVLIGTWDLQCNRTDEESTWTCADNAAEISGHGSGTWDSTTGTLETDEWGTLTTAACQP